MRETQSAARLAAAPVLKCAAAGGGEDFDAIWEGDFKHMSCGCVAIFIEF